MFTFFFGGHHVKILLADMVASKKKKVNTRFSMGCATQPRLDCTFAIFFRSCSKFFSALEIKDNSKFNKGQGRGVQIKDCPLK